jgi:hypothetical protein
MRLPFFVAATFLTPCVFRISRPRRLPCHATWTDFFVFVSCELLTVLHFVVLVVLSFIRTFFICCYFSSLLSLISIIFPFIFTCNILLGFIYGMLHALYPLLHNLIRTMRVDRKLSPSSSHYMPPYTCYNSCVT